MIYAPVKDYVAAVRYLLQDEIDPFRYTDDNVVMALNMAMFEISRVRPDMFLDMKYQQPLRQGDIGDGIPQWFSSTKQQQVVPIPSKYIMPVRWYMEGWLQTTDVADTTDQRAQAFLQKFQMQLMQVTTA
jgi:hypothetical protein